MVGTHAPAKTIALHSETDSAFQADLRKTFIDSLPATLVTLRASLQSLVKADNEMTRLKEIYELYRRVHALNGNASIAGLIQIAHMSAALEALLKEIYEKPKNINTSTLRTVAAGVDFLGFLFERGNAAGNPGSRRPPTSWSWTTKPFRAAPSFTRWKRPSSSPSTSSRRKPP